MLKSLRYFFASTLIMLASCNSVTVGGGVSGGSSGDIDLGVGVGIELLTQPLQPINN